MVWWPWNYKQAGSTTSDVTVACRDPHAIYQGEYAYCDECSHFFDLRDKRALIVTEENLILCPACSLRAPITSQTHPQRER